MTGDASVPDAVKGGLVTDYHYISPSLNGEIF